jgi:hypothetical protein
MTGYKNKYLEMLKAEKSKKHPGEEPSKPSKIALRSSLNNFEGFEGTQVGAFSEFSPPLDAEGVPCGLCTICRRGEFWRWPKFHKDHSPNGWVCWFCSPPPPGGGPCDFCGVPEDNAEDTPCKNL